LGVKVILGHVGRHLGTMLREQVEYRELLASVTRRDLILRYKQAAMGVGWALLTPVLHMAIFTIIFTRVVPLETDIPYPIYAYAGLLPWSFFAGSLRFSVVSLTNNTTLVTKVYFPREIFPFATVLVGLVDFAVASVVLVGLMLYFEIAVGWTVLFVPVVLATQIVFTAGIGLVLAMANLFYRDVRYVFDVLIVVWMFATSVVYPVERVGGRLGDILALNPMTPIIDAYRTVLLRGELPPAAPFATAAVIAVTTLVIAWLTFHNAEHRFAENI
jgi:ABC-type polysaccharide/polyol phosphate export permease